MQGFAMDFPIVAISQTNHLVVGVTARIMNGNAGMGGVYGKELSVMVLTIVETNQMKENAGRADYLEANKEDHQCLDA